MGRLESLRQAQRERVRLPVFAVNLGDVPLEVGPAVAALQGGADPVRRGCHEGVAQRSGSA